MKIFGHPWIESPTLYLVNTIDDIKMTPPNAIVLLNPLSSSLELAKYCQKHQILYALKTQNIKEGLFANQLGCKFIVCSKELAVTLIPIAQNYLFDTEVLALIEEEIEIEEMAKKGVDGVLYRNNY